MRRCWPAMSCGLALAGAGRAQRGVQRQQPRLAGMLDKLHIPSVGPGGAQKLADKFASLEGAILAADWLDMRQTLAGEAGPGGARIFR